MRPLEFTTLVCLCIQQVTHAKAAHSNVRNQLNGGNFEIASTDFRCHPDGWSYPGTSSFTNRLVIVPTHLLFKGARVF